MNNKLLSAGLTLAKAKQYLNDNFVTYTITQINDISGMYFGLDVWNVSALEEVSNVNSVRKRNFRLYTQGLEEKSKAWWEATQGPMSPSATTPELSFASRVEVYIKTQVDSGTIKFGFVVQLNESQKKAICNVIMPDNSNKSILVSEDSKGKFNFEVLA